MQKNLYQIQQSTVKYRFSFRTLSDRNMKMDCHEIFFFQRLNLDPRGYLILDTAQSFLGISSDSPKNLQNLLVYEKLDEKIRRNTQKIRRKS